MLKKKIAFEKLFEILKTLTTYLTFLNSKTKNQRL